MKMNIQELIEATKQIDDPRRPWGNLRHKLSDVLVIAFCAIICGAQTYDELALFGKARYTWLSWFLNLPNKTPSADTFQRVFEVLDPHVVAKKLRKIFADEELVEKIIAFDGKTMRGSKNDKHSAVHVLSAFLTDDQIVIGEEIVDKKSNEITAIPQLLDEINVKGATVTIDAMGCQTEIAEKIIAKGAHYVLALKGNQGTLHGVVKNYFAMFTPSHSTATLEEGGREELREYFLETGIEWLTKQPHELPQAFDWKGVAGIGMVRSTVKTKGKTREQTRYFITSLTKIEQFSHAVRSHWGIENRLHWHLDVTFGEDASRICDKNAAAVWNVLRKTALEYLQRVDPGKHVSIKSRRKLAAWDNSYIEQVLASVTDVK
jgi:predicted transposase YbfD/YdcC